MYINSNFSNELRWFTRLIDDRKFQIRDEYNEGI